MPDFLYRFRSAETLLGQQELERQDIYFCAPEHLNDPIEGFKDIYWRGDAVVWTNLLKHYAITLMQTGILCFTPGEPVARVNLRNAIKLTPEDIADPDIRAMCEAGAARFVADDAVQHFIQWAVVRERPIRRNELIAYFRGLHPIAMLAVTEQLATRNIIGRIPAFLEGMDWNLHRQNIIKVLNSSGSWARLNNGDEMAAEAFYAASESTTMQLDLIGEYQIADRTAFGEQAFFIRYFAAAYVEKLDNLVHPNWYAACFTSDPLNATMWGAYGHGHRGICLKFKVKETSGRPTLELRKATGMDGSGAIHKSFVPIEFHEVKYEAKFPPIDFFRSMGGVRIIQLNHFWYRGDDGAISECRKGLALDDEPSRQSYWETFARSFGIKTSDWAHEKEYRLVHHDYGFNLDPPDMRLLDYKFEDLAGIVFGARTIMEDKLAIMRIVDAKCQANERTDFEFSEVRYAPESGTFRMAPLSLLRPVQTSDPHDNHSQKPNAKR